MNEDLQALRLLYDKIQRVSSLKNQEMELEELATHIETLKALPLTEVMSFDESHKVPYILSHIGQEPEKPKRTILRFRTKVREKIKAYKEELEQYHLQYAKWEKAYYEEYAEQRAKIQEEEQQKKDKDIQEAEQRYKELKKKINDAKEELAADDTLSDKLKDPQIIETLIGYFLDKRVDTLRDAVTLYYEEEQKRQQEERAEKQAQMIARILEIAEGLEGDVYSIESELSEIKSELSDIRSDLASISSEVSDIRSDQEYS